MPILAYKAKIVFLKESSQIRVVHVLEHGADVHPGQIDDEAGRGVAAARAADVVVPVEVAQLGPAPLAAQPAVHRHEGVIHPTNRLHKHALGIISLPFRVRLHYVTKPCFIRHMAVLSLLIMG